MDYALVHHAGAVSVETAARQTIRTGSLIKIGLDAHSQFYMAVLQQDHATPGAPRRFTPEAFVPWVRTLLAAGHEVHVVYEGCGFGFGLQRALSAAGANCYVIGPQALDESHSGVKTDGRDARTLCLRLDRYLQGNQHALAVIRVPNRGGGTAAARLAQAGAKLVRHRSKMQAQGRGLLVNHGLPARSSSQRR